jgi:homoserine kinase
MQNASVLVRAPATVGNFGGAYHCAALALDPPLNVKVTPRADGYVGIRYFGENGERVPRNRANLVVRAMQAALHLRGLEFSGADFEIYSSVPVAVGLGSSTAAVLAGLLAADALYALELDEKTIFELAAIYETRLDNLHAAWLGGFVACTEEDSRAVCRRTIAPANFALSVVAPASPLVTNSPEPSNAAVVPGKDRALHLERASALLEFFSRPGRQNSLDSDAPLPPTCNKRVPGLEAALEVRLPGLLMTFVCGSGPAIGILTSNDPAPAIQAVGDCFARAGVDSTHGTFLPTNSGAREWNAVRANVQLPKPRTILGLPGAGLA